MPTRVMKIKPEEYILSVLSKEDRLSAALAVAGEAFNRTELTMDNIEKAVKTIRKKAHEKNRIVVDTGVLISAIQRPLKQ
jgi:hypothetical protein